VPNVPAIVGYTGFAQAGVFDGALPGGFGLTNAISVTVLPNRAPTRAYIPGQNFAGGPGLMTILDLSVQPPVFRATGSVGFGGNIGNNFPTKIAVADGQGIAYALGNSSTNQFVRAFNVASDPAGVVTYAAIGDIPTAGTAYTAVATNDMEVTSDGHYLFTITGDGILQVFDCSGMPATIPTSAIQTISFSGAAGGSMGLELSPANDRLAVVISADSQPPLTIYDITPGAPQPLSLFATVPLLGTYTGSTTPSDVHFTPDGHQLFVSGTYTPPNLATVGYFSVIDVQTSPPTVLIPGQYWNPVTGNLWCHGSAVALMNGSPVGIVGAEGSGFYTVYDLNPTSATFGMSTYIFSTNPGGNISNHRMHGRGSIVVAIDGTGPTSFCEWVDVIDLNQPIAPFGFASWRVHMPNHASLTPGLGSAIPRDFDVY